MLECLITSNVFSKFDGIRLTLGIFFIDRSTVSLHPSKTNKVGLLTPSESIYCDIGPVLSSPSGISINSNSFVVLESSISKAFKLDNVGIGFTVKYLKGLLGFSYLELDDSEFTTTADNINLSSGAYLLRQNTMGEGFGLDFGFSNEGSETTAYWDYPF